MITDILLSTSFEPIIPARQCMDVDYVLSGQRFRAEVERRIGEAYPGVKLTWTHLSGPCAAPLELVVTVPHGRFKVMDNEHPILQLVRACQRDPSVLVAKQPAVARRA